MKLEEFPNVFQIDYVVKKGFFPYKLNCSMFQDYNGAFPAKHYFSVEHMNVSKVKEFEIWYENEKKRYELNNLKYNLKNELHQYCFSDVNILARGCLIFRKMFLEITQSEIFHNFTLSQFCMRYFRNNFVNNDTIAIINDTYQPFTTNIKHSKSSLRWLAWESHKNNINIRTFKHPKGEKCIIIEGNKIFVDGFDSTTNTVYEYLGCFYHRHDVCYPPHDQSSQISNSNAQIFAQTISRLKLIEQEYNLKYIWECQFENEIKTNPQLSLFLKENDIVDDIKARDAMFGGRVEAFSVNATHNENELISYFDVVSEYPFVMYTKKFPTGFPEKIENPKISDFHSYFGIAKIKILPPKRLNLPVLPYRRKDGRIFFPLCVLCVENSVNDYCNHTNEDRVMVGTYTTPEISLAISKGYTLKKIYEVWHWDTTVVHDKKNNQNGLFNEYIDKFLKTKIENTGWEKLLGSEKNSAEARKNFIETLYEKHGILIDEKSVRSTPLRLLAKLCLNSLFGRLCMKEPKKKLQL